MEKEKLLFIASCEVDLSLRTGVTIKIINQLSVLEKEYDVFLVAFSKSGILIYNDGKKRTIESRNRRKERIRQCRALCDEHQIKKCFIRFSALEPSFIMMLKAVRACGADIVLEIPTYPYDSELKDSLKHRLLLVCDRMLRKKLKKYVSRIVTYSEDKRIYGIDCINIGNGIDVFGQPVSEEYVPGSRIVFIGVAKVSFWHGYDRLIKGIARYTGPYEVLFNVVGDGPALEECKSLADSLGVLNKVVFYGFKSGRELDEIYYHSNIGVDCLGLHRKGMSRVSSLKSREYAARGIPILTATFFDTIPDDWKYLMKEPSDDTEIDVEHVLSRFLKIADNKDYRYEIREFAEKNLDISATFQPVLDYYSGISNK